MTKTFTHVDLIRYYYKETNEQETLEIKNALLADPDLSDEYHQLKELINNLNHIYKSPSDPVIKSIIDYSKSFNLQSSK